MALRLAVAVFMVFIFFLNPVTLLFHCLRCFLELNFPKIFLKLLCFRSFFLIN